VTDTLTSKPPEPVAAGPRRTWSRSGGRAFVPLIAFAVVLAVVGLVADETWIDLANLAAMAAIGAIGLDLLLGHTGLISVGNAALLAVGAFVVAATTRAAEVPMLFGVLLAGVTCGLLGILVALPALRITGLYLAIATMGFHFVAIWALREWQTGQVGDSGFVVPTPTIFGVEIYELHTWFVLLAVVLVLVVGSYTLLVSGRPGRALHAIRERPALAEMSGVSTTRHKVTAFAYSSFLIGVAGALNAYYLGQVSYANYASLHIAIEYLAMVILGGLGTIYGPVIGATVITILPQLISEARVSFGLEGAVSTTDVYLWQGALVGLVVSLMVVFRPQGLAGLGRAVVERVRR
jgi:branched-chain amino acid transport system permease protein